MQKSDAGAPAGSLQPRAEKGGGALPNSANCWLEAEVPVPGALTTGLDSPAGNLCACEACCDTEKVEVPTASSTPSTSVNPKRLFSKDCSSAERLVAMTSAYQASGDVSSTASKTGDRSPKMWERVVVPLTGSCHNH